MKGRTLILSSCTLLISTAVKSHHNPAAHYLVDERVEIAGTVTEFRPVNPHARIYFDVTNEAGQTEGWMAEGDSIINLRRAGWTNDQLKPGDRVNILGRPSRNGSNLIEWTFITMPDGTEVGGGNGQQGERLRILEQRLVQYREQRDQTSR
jgi:hypothetical protein